MEESLIKLGLSEKEAAVYLALLELGEDTAQNISQKAKLKRATTYVILERLMGLGLVSTAERGKKTMFVAESPEELVNILEDQKRQIDSRKKYLDEAMTQLKAVYNASGNKPAVRYFEGADGIEALDRYGKEHIKPGSEMLSIYPIDLIEDKMAGSRKNAISDRVKRGIKSRVIYTHRDGEISGYINEKELREGVFVPRSELPLDAIVEIFPGWGVKFYNFNKENYFGVLVQSPDMARNLCLMFELAWEAAQAKAKKRK